MSVGSIGGAAASSTISFDPRDLNKDGKVSAADKWLTDVARSAGCKVRLVATPDAHKDANDWLRSGATWHQFTAAVEAATIVPPPPPASKKQRATCPDWAELGLVTINEEKRKQFPTDALPPPFSAMVRQVATINQVPESLSAIITLGIMASSIGRGIAGRLIKDKHTRANLYLIAAVASGEGKTTTCEPLRKPIEDLASERLEAWSRKDLPQAKARKAALERQIKLLNEQIDGDTLPAEADKLINQIADKNRALGIAELEIEEPALIVEDVTSEKLAVLMKQSGETLSLISSDGGDVVANILGRYRGNKAAVDDGIYVKAFSGDPVRVSRVNRPPLVLKSPCLTMLLLVQHDKLDMLLSNPRLIEGGLMPRFLMARIPCTPSHIGTEVVQLPPETVKAYDIAIRTLVENFRDRTEAIVIVGTPSARQAIADYHNEIADRRGNTLKDIGGFAARWPEQACRIAIVLHAAKHASNAQQQEIQEDTVMAAIEIAKWFEGEQLAVLERARAGGLEQSLTAVWRYARTKPEGFTQRDLMRKHIFEDAETAATMLVQLEEKGVIASERNDTGGRPTNPYRLADLT